MASKTIRILIALSSISLCLGRDAHQVSVTVQGVTSIASTDEHYICATLDWWPHDKCDYDQCPWANTNILNLDLNNTIIVNAVKAFGNMRIRIGGSLQDQVVYQAGPVTKCPHFKKNLNPLLFGFSRGCLNMKRWDEINQFFSKTGAMMTFGLNALKGRKINGYDQSQWIGSWNPKNAIDFMLYTIPKGYKIHSYELGNELAGSGVHAKVAVEQYARDMIVFKQIVKDLYPEQSSRPKVLGPSSFFVKTWFSRFLEASGPDVVDGMTHHIYNLGPGVDPNLIKRVQDPLYLDIVAKTFEDAEVVVKEYGPWAQAWVGESGGAYNSGGKTVSHTFANSFWYLDQLGMAATFDHKVYCRQTLVGGNYGLLNTTSLIPNPDYYGALLRSRLMGNRVLAVTHSGPPELRVYAHCLKHQEQDKKGNNETGIALLLINLGKDTLLEIKVVEDFGLYPPNDVDDSDKDGELQDRLEYRLTPKDGDIQSDVVLLNGQPLELTESEDVPELAPDHKDPHSKIHMEPQSIVFTTLRYFNAPACAIEN